MDFKAKGELSQAPAGYLPWFEVPGRRSAATVLVTGHWSALGLRLEPNLLSLDSGCLWGGKLSALRLEDRALFQVDCAADEAVPLFKE
jgi:bis(5'-nucleosyl)-tetraphosphatase (symmetrical)